MKTSGLAALVAIAATPCAAVASGAASGHRSLAGTWRVVGVAVDTDGVQALTRDDPAYMGREIVITGGRIAWKKAGTGAANTSDVCEGYAVRPQTGAAGRQSNSDYAKLVGSLGIAARNPMVIRCARGNWGPDAAGGSIYYSGGANVIAFSWYDGGVLKLKRQVH